MPTLHAGVGRSGRINPGTRRISRAKRRWSRVAEHELSDACSRWITKVLTDSLGGTEGVVDRYARTIDAPSGQDADEVFRRLEGPAPAIADIPAAHHARRDGFRDGKRADVRVPAATVHATDRAHLVLRQVSGLNPEPPLIEEATVKGRALSTPSGPCRPQVDRKRHREAA